MSEFAGRVAVIVGGETGIGLAISEAFAQAGATVFIGGILVEQGEAAAARLSKAGHRVTFTAADVRDVAQVDSLIAQASDSSGRLDILVYSAAVFDGYADCVETTDALWDTVLDINLRGCFFACRGALRIMQPQRRGRIINISSIAALRPMADGLSYSASKFGMIGLTRHAAATSAESGITVNAICPGVIQTDMRRNSGQILGDTAPDMNRGIGAGPDGYKRFVPAARRGATHEVAALTLFLASDAAGYITGQALPIDGGWSAT